uniref:Uncharacterized protein n=1 Tax=Romanomermis culicivorax TaxID=13658 RepID=A0A915IA19_ROMCU
MRTRGQTKEEGNITAIPIINRIGMTIGILLWSFTGLLSGWASSRFGWFGMKPQKPSSDLLNYSGLILSLIRINISLILLVFVKFSALVFVFIENVPEKKVDRQVSHEKSNDNKDMGTNRRSPSQIDCDDDDVENLLGSDNVTVIGDDNGSYGSTVLRISSTLFLHHERLMQALIQTLCYVFAFTVGVMASCTFYFVIYAAYKGSRPYIDPNLCLPAFVAGIFWAVAQTAFFVANESLSEAVSFPIISRSVKLEIPTSLRFELDATHFLSSGKTTSYFNLRTTAQTPVLLTVRGWLPLYGAFFISKKYKYVKIKLSTVEILKTTGPGVSQCLTDYI